RAQQETLKLVEAFVQVKESKLQTTSLLAKILRPEVTLLLAAKLEPEYIKGNKHFVFTKPMDSHWISWWMRRGMRGLRSTWLGLRRRRKRSRRGRGRVGRAGRRRRLRRCIASWLRRISLGTRRCAWMGRGCWRWSRTAWAWRSCARARRARWCWTRPASMPTPADRWAMWAG